MLSTQPEVVVFSGTSTSDQSKRMTKAQAKAFMVSRMLNFSGNRLNTVHSVFEDI